MIILNYRNARLLAWLNPKLKHTLEFTDSRMYVHQGDKLIVIVHYTGTVPNGFVLPDLSKIPNIRPHQSVGITNRGFTIERRHG